MSDNFLGDASAAAIASFSASPDPTPSAPVEAAVAAPVAAAAPSVDTPAVVVPATPVVEPVGASVPTVDAVAAASVADPELQSDRLRHADYTKKTQSLAEERRAFEAQRNELQSEAQRLFNDPNFLADRLRTVMNIPAEGTPDPAQVVTAAELAQFQTRLMAEAQSAAQREVMDTVAQVEFIRERESFRGQINDTIQNLVNTTPELRLIPGIDRVLKDEVGALKLPSIAEVKSKLAEHAAHHAQGVRSFVQEQLKTNAVKQAENLKPIEPPGGTPQTLAPNNSFKLGDKDLTNAAAQFLSGLMSK